MAITPNLAQDDWVNPSIPDITDIGDGTPEGGKALDEPQTEGGDPGTGQTYDLPDLDLQNLLADLGYDVSGMTGEQQTNATWELLYNLAYTMMDPAQWQVSGQQIYDAATKGMAEDYGQAQLKNRYDLEMAGLGGSGTGYSDVSPYSTTEGNYLDALAGISMRSELAAKDMSWDRMLGALGAGAGLEQLRFGETMDIFSELADITQYYDELQSQEDMAKDAFWADIIGSGADLLGSAAGAFLGMI